MTFFHRKQSSSQGRAPVKMLENRTTDGPVSLIIRNCSSIECMEWLSEKLGYVARVGRYFVPETTDIGAISAICAERGLHMRRTDLGSMTVLDVMRDRELTQPS